MGYRHHGRAEWPTYVLNLVEFGGIRQGDSQALAFTLYKDGLMESA
jgi:hypothetical protein